MKIYVYENLFNKYLLKVMLYSLTGNNIMVVSKTSLITKQSYFQSLLTVIFKEHFHFFYQVLELV
jgi:hypothetical protein